jgi:hypothetical protein
MGWMMLFHCVVKEKIYESFLPVKYHHQAEDKVMEEKACIPSTVSLAQSSTTFILHRLLSRL